MGRLRSPQGPGRSGQGLRDGAPGHHGSWLLGLCEGLGVTPIKAQGRVSTEGVWRHLGWWPQNISRGVWREPPLLFRSIVWGNPCTMGRNSGKPAPRQCGRDPELSRSIVWGNPCTMGRHSGKPAPGQCGRDPELSQSVVGMGPGGPAGRRGAASAPEISVVTTLQCGPHPWGCSPSGPFPLLTFGLRVREGLCTKGRARGRHLVPPGVPCLVSGSLLH